MHAASDGEETAEVGTPGTGPETADDPSAPGRVGRFELHAELGRGGMGVVFRARDTTLGRDVALKRIRLRGLDPRNVARLMVEARALAQLSHENVVTVYDVPRQGGDVWVAMELVEGQTLTRWLEADRSWREVVEVFIGAGRGLAAAHAMQIVHRDFKPSNVLIGRDGRARVLDFGLALLDGSASAPRTPGSSAGVSSASGSSSGLTEAGTVMGTPPYMAPEQHRGEPVDARADQFAFAVALFAALFERLPFPREQREMVAAKLAGRIADVELGEVPSAVHDALRRALAAKPAARWPDMDALLDVLTAAVAPPRPARWPWLAAAGAGAVVLAVALRSPADSDPPPCLDDVTAQTLWPAARRAAVETALRGDGKSYAIDNAQRVLQRLDAYAERWLQTRETICNATDAATVRGSRLDCLVAARAELDALTTGLAEVEDDAGNKAAVAVGHLPRPADCLDAETRQGHRRPDDPQLAATIDRLRADVRRAKVMIETARYDQAIELLEGIEAETEATGDAWAHAELLHHLGAAKLRAGDVPAARERLEQAYFTAHAARHETLAATSLAWLVYVVDYLQRDPSASKQWVEAAEREIDNEAIPADVRAMLLNHLGSAASAAGDFRRSRELWTRGRTLVEDELDGDPLLLAPLLTNIANSHDDVGEHDEALQLSLEAIALKERAFGPDHPTLGYSLNNIGVTYQLVGRFPEAKQALERAVDLRVKAHGWMHPDVAVSLANLATLEQAMGDTDEAATDLARALEIRLQTLGPDDLDVAINESQLGNLERERGRLEQARLHYERAVETFEAKVGPDNPALATPLNGLGKTLSQLGRHQDAIELLERALAIRTRHEVPPADRANSMYALGLALHASGQTERGRELVVEARLLYGDVPATREYADKLDAWLAAHP